MGSVIDYLPEADALTKAKGVFNHKFGSDTSHIVCGGMLCSEYADVKTGNIDMYFNEIRDDPSKLVDFFTKMPKGADLHNHLSGNTQPEILIQLAAENNLCFNLITFKLVKPDGATLLCPDGYEPVLSAYADESLYSSLLRDWSVYDFQASAEESGHEHFFSVFDKIHEVTVDVSTLLGYWKIVAHEQNMQYGETMFNDPHIWSEIDELSSKITINDSSDLSLAYHALKEEIQEQKTIENSAMNISNYELESTLFCMEKNYPCDIPFNYIFQILRALESDHVFTQMVIGFETVRQSEHFVAINMVQPEDDENSIKNYALHMEMLAFLKVIYPDVHVTLHAGELWTTLPSIDPKTDMSFHIHDAIQKASAERIGHGVDIAYEVKRFPNLVDIMQENSVAVEINLNSNYLILDIKPDEHPILFYLKHDIPIVMSTDDPGITLSNMTNEYVVATMNYPQIQYSDFKDMVRNSLEYSFLAGKSLWKDPQYSAKIQPCAKRATHTSDCWMEKMDEKAALQNMLELEFNQFESSIRNSK